MTYEEAFEWCMWFSFDVMDNMTPHEEKCPQVLEAMVRCVSALEKQIPKKPFHMHKNYYCPNCKEGGWMLWDDAVPNDKDNFCGKCGQAIDWSDDD